MPAQVIDGKAIAAELRAQVATDVAVQRERGLVPGLTVVLVGDDPASVIYTRNKQQVAEELGMHSELIRLPAGTPQAELEGIIRRLNGDRAVHGILVQHPMGASIDEDRIFALIDPRKDVDGFHPVNVGNLWAGRRALVACTPAGVMHMLRATGVDPKGKRAVVVGRSNIVGKPVAALLLQAHATVTVCHSRTQDLPAVCREADILVAAIGKLEMLTADYIKPGAVVIDVGTNPVPGGVGPMTIAMLMQNTLTAAKAIWGVA